MPFQIIFQINAENKRTATLGEAHFVQYVDSLYKVSNPTNSFCYLDFIQPTPKKTFRMLQVLLNYYFFYKMLKDDTLEKVVPLQKTRDSLKTEVNKMTVELEKTKISAENVGFGFILFVEKQRFQWQSNLI